MNEGARLRNARKSKGSGVDISWLLKLEKGTNPGSPPSDESKDGDPQVLQLGLWGSDVAVHGARSVDIDTDDNSGRIDSGGIADGTGSRRIERGEFAVAQ